MMKAVCESWVTEYKLMMVKDSGQAREKECLFATNVMDPATSALAVKGFFDGADREMFGVLALNTRNRVIGFNMVSVGTLDSTIVHPRDVFKFAIMSNACAIICFHNHPSGDTEPSSEDINLTKRLVDVGELVGIPLLDHIIIGEEGKYLSMKNRNLI